MHRTSGDGLCNSHTSAVRHRQRNASICYEALYQASLLPGRADVDRSVSYGEQRDWDLFDSLQRRGCHGANVFLRSLSLAHVQVFTYVGKTEEGFASRMESHLNDKAERNRVYGLVHGQ
jgi:hypothetical protein